MSSRDYFDSIAGRWDAMQASFFSEKVRDTAICKSGVKAGHLVADIGAGTGFMTDGLIACGARVIAVDQSGEMLNELRKKMPDVGILETREGESTWLPLEDAAVDAAFANMYLHHVEAPGDAVREMARIVRPGGAVVITDLDTHTFEFLRTEQHDRWLGFERAEISRLFAGVGLVDVSVDDVGDSCCTCSQICGSAASISIFLAIGRKP